MRNLWSKEDIANFEDSEVFAELEKRVLANISRADILMKKMAEADLSGTADSASKATQEVNKLTDAMNKLNTAMSADDPEVDDAMDEEVLEAEIVDDLRSMAKLAVEKGDFKLAYKIERTIDEILEPELTCE